MTLMDPDFQIPPMPVAAGERITLRDYFAAQAPVTLDDVFASMAAQGITSRKGPDVFKAMSELRWAYADAMLAERARK